MVNRKKILLIVVLFCSALSFAGSKVMYKWIDKSGNTVYGDRPPTGVEYQRIKVRDSDKSSSPTPITQKLAPKKIDSSEDQEQLNKAKKQMEEVCNVAKANLETLQTAAKVAIKDPEADEGTRPMTDEEREAKTKQAKERIAKYCKK